MSDRIKEFHRPKDWASVHKLLGRKEVTTKAYAQGPRPSAIDDLNAEAVVDLEKLALRYIRSVDAVMHLGSLATLQDLVESDEVKKIAGGLLSEAAYVSATLGVRNLATLAGALLTPDGHQDLTAALLALEAAVVIQKTEGQTRTVALQDFVNNRTNALVAGEVILEVTFSTAFNAGNLARVARSPRDQAIVAAAAALVVKNGVVQNGGVALIGASAVPLRLAGLEKLLGGKSLSADLLVQTAALAEKSASPVGDYLGSAEYRREMAGILSRRALETAWQMGKKA